MGFGKVMAAVGMAGMLAGCGSTEIREVPVEATPTPAGELHALSLGETNRIVGEVRIKNDALTLFVEVSAFPGAMVNDIRVCAGTSAFRYIAPESCGYRAALSGKISKGMLAIALSDFGEMVVGDVVYVQVAAAIHENGELSGWAYAGLFKGRVGYTVEGSEISAAGACVLSASDWAGGKVEWPATGLKLGGDDYRADELVDLLARPIDGDASIALAKQLVAAKLNQANGATLPSGIAAAVQSMDAWLAAEADLDGSLPFQLKATPEHLENPEAFDTGVNMGEMFRQFNAGRLASSPACE